MSSVTYPIYRQKVFNKTQTLLARVVSESKVEIIVLNLDKENPSFKFISEPLAMGDEWYSDYIINKWDHSNDKAFKHGLNKLKKSVNEIH